MVLRRLDPGESLIGTRECGSYAAHAWAVAALSSLACLARRRFGSSGPTARPFRVRRSDASISMRMSFECIQCLCNMGSWRHGLRWGFKVGLHPDRLHGFRFFKNYETATVAFRSRVTEATEARVIGIVIGGRTLLLGEATDDTLRLIKEVFPSAFIFLMGAVAKPLVLPDKGRPTSGHTRTGLNAATDMTQ